MSETITCRQCGVLFCLGEQIARRLCLGKAVAAVLAESFPTPVIRVGVDDEFSQSGLLVGDRDALKEHFELAASDIASTVRKSAGMK
jgi:transketolase